MIVRLAIGLLGLFSLLALEGEGDGDEDGDGDDDDDRSSFKPPKDQAELDRMISRRMKTAVDKAVTKAVADTKATIEQEQREAKAKADKDLAEQLQIADEKRQAAERERDQERQERLKDRVAAAHKLPSELAELLKGSTEEELTAHAKTLQKHLKGASSSSESNDAADDNDTSGGTDNDAGARGTRQGNRSRISAPQFQIVSTARTAKFPGS